MKFYFLLGLSLCLFLAQIIFSFFYSNQMVRFNYTNNLYQKQLDNLTLQNQNLQIQLSRLTSIDFLKNQAGNLSPIDKTFP